MRQQSELPVSYCTAGTACAATHGQDFQYAEGSWTEFDEAIRISKTYDRFVGRLPRPQLFQGIAQIALIDKLCRIWDRTFSLGLFGINL